VAQSIKAERGVSLIELITTVLIIGILAAVSVPMAGAEGRLAVPLTARHLTSVLRLAQTIAQTERTIVRFQVAAGSWSVRRTGAEGSAQLAAGDLGPVSCTTNYPGGWVEFDRRGYPLSTGSTPRAGSFVFSAGGLQSTVVLQLTGRVRIR